MTPITQLTHGGGFGIEVSSMVECRRQESVNSPAALTNHSSWRMNSMAEKKSTRLPAEAFIGVRFNCLIVNGVFRKNGRTYATCTCDCGSRTERLLGGIRDGRIKGCGCMRGLSRRKHGESHVAGNTPEYRAWCLLRSRCNRKTDPRFSSYGGRGISVCGRWNDFANFLEDMGRRPSPRHSIDRINNNGNYEPGNCRWATATQQSLNTRRNVLLTLNGETRALSVWAQLLNIDRATLAKRLRLGWSVERTLTTLTVRGRA